MRQSHKKMATKKKVTRKKATRKKLKGHKRKATRRPYPTRPGQLAIVAADIRPSVADVIVTSVDQKGGMGRLTAYVLGDLGAPTSILPRGSDLRKGRGVVVTPFRSKRIIFVHPDVRDPGGKTLFEQLVRAFKSLRIGQSVWVPLLAQWVEEGLSPLASMRATCVALRRFEDRGRTIISLPEDLTKTDRERVVREARKILGKISTSATDMRAFEPAPDLELLALAFRLTLARKLEPDDLLHPKLDPILGAVASAGFMTDDGVPDIAAAWEGLPAKVEPNPLWVAWMKNTLADVLDRLEGELRGSVS